LPAIVEDELVQFFWPRCIMHRGGALRVHSDASDGLHRWRGSTAGARVSGLWMEPEREGKGSTALGFLRRRGASCRRQGGGGLHQERRRSGGGSSAWERSTELLPARGGRRLEAVPGLG
jgi:hypothetical protein